MIILFDFLHFYEVSEPILVRFFRLLIINQSINQLVSLFYYTSAFIFQSIILSISIIFAIFFTANIAFELYLHFFEAISILTIFLIFHDSFTFRSFHHCGCFQRWQSSTITALAGLLLLRDEVESRQFGATFPVLSI